MTKEEAIKLTFEIQASVKQQLKEEMGGNWVRSPGEVNIDILASVLTQAAINAMFLPSMLDQSQGIPGLGEK